MRVKIIKLLTLANYLSLMYWLCWVDAISSWQPWVIMGCNLLWLTLVGIANGWFYTGGEKHE